MNVTPGDPPLSNLLPSDPARPRGSSRVPSSEDPEASASKGPTASGVGLPRFRLDGRVCFIAGGSVRSGGALAFALAHAGAAVAVSFGDDGPGTEELVSKVKRSGGRCVAVPGEVTRLSEAEAKLAELVGVFHRIDVLVNQSDPREEQPFLEIREASWNTLYQASLRSLILTSQVVSRRLVEQGHGGRIVNILAPPSDPEGLGHAQFHLARGAIRGLTRAMARELAPFDVLVNAIEPGAMESPMTSGPSSESVAKKPALGRIPKGRLGRPDDLVGLAVFLAGDESDYVTGSTFVVDGGLRID